MPNTLRSLLLPTSLGIHAKKGEKREKKKKLPTEVAVHERLLSPRLPKEGGGGRGDMQKKTSMARIPPAAHSSEAKKGGEGSVVERTHTSAFVRPLAPLFLSARRGDAWEDKTGASRAPTTTNVSVIRHPKKRGKSPTISDEAKLSSVKLMTAAQEAGKGGEKKKKAVTAPTGATWTAICSITCPWNLSSFLRRRGERGEGKKGKGREE